MRDVPFAVVLAVLGSACGSATGQPATSKTHTVIIEGVRFQPERLTVAHGDTVVWVNKDLVAHTATFEAGSFDSGAIQPEKSWRFIATKTGEFDYLCTFHPGMKAVLNVR